MMARTPVEDVEEQLRRATSWEEAVPRGWAKALEKAIPTHGRLGGVSTRVIAALRRPWGVAAAVLVVVGAGITLTALLTDGEARLSRRVAWPASAPLPSESVRGYPGSGKYELPASPAVDGLKEASAAADVQRVVIRNATISLEAKDVRAVFGQVGLLVSEARGEYIQDSSLTGGTGEGRYREPLAGQLTLRVAAGRLSEVLNSLRGLGAVVSETSGGEDVTGQAVDLEARLRNEQRVETELLELLGARQDASLGDVLQLREQIARVRERVEQLTAQRDRLSHLASLATVLVIIREPDSARADAVTGSYFTSRVARAWEGGLLSLSDSIAWLVGVLVGGTVWWVLLGIVTVLVVRRIRRGPPMV